MSIFTITLIENDINSAAHIIYQLGMVLDSHRISIVKPFERALSEPEKTDVILLNVAQLITNPVDCLYDLQQAYPYIPIIGLKPAGFDDDVLVELLEAGLDDYIELSRAGLLALERRAISWYEKWSSQAETVPAHLQTIFQETAALYQVASALATTHDPLSMMEIVLGEFLRALHLKQGRVFRFLDKNTKAFLFHLDMTQANRRSFNETTLYHDDPLYQMLQHTGQPLLLPNRQAGHLQTISGSETVEINIERWFSLSMQRSLLLPLKVRHQVIGVMIAETPSTDHFFHDYEISLGQAMADQLSIALQNISLYEAEQRRREQSEILREVSYIVGSSLNLNEVLENVLDQLARVIAYDKAVIYLVEKERRRIIAGRGFENGELIGRVFPKKLDDNEPEMVVINHQTPHIIMNMAEDCPDFDHPLGNDFQSWLGIPLIAREHVIGLITVTKAQPRAYHQDHAELGLAFAQHVSIALENARLHQLSVSRIEHELAIAQEIQETLLPQVVPQIPGLQISGRILPARQVGGDFFHFFPVGGGDQLGVAVGDVSGKGIPAALYMAVAITAIDIQVRTDPPPGELMNRLNQALYARLKENKMNIGLQVAIFEPLLPPEGDTGIVDNEARGVLMTAASGGMIAPIGATERGCRFLPVSGLPIGALPHPDNVYEDDMFLLDPFTTIIFTSDGIVEAQNETGELFGFDRLESTINEIAHTRDAERVADYIIEAAQNFMGKAEQNDDMTVVVVVKT